ncbi:nicolin-1-like isoform X2 [Actinia tenebrosa]|uniref:Nicolin-1-like isoform X2 n=1 Tax=Actinia tenebrosa TaxID=6105 RepID=A0A6P8J2C3_ACTTE|nr:nicolin-1-like isoform X2 [Actinia tenebrosa]
MDSSKESSLDCIVRKPVFLRDGDLTSEFKSGCAVVDILFPGHDTVNIVHLTFKNNYTASVELKAKIKEDKGETWKVCIKKLVLMPHPHYEAGSQCYVSITSDMMCFPTDNVVMLRLILRQSSPHWATFGIENPKCYIPSLFNLTSAPWLSNDNESNDVAVPKPKHQGLPKSENVAELMQRMWAMTEEIKAAKTERIGRFDIDGSYDVNLLSYT